MINWYKKNYTNSILQLHPMIIYISLPMQIILVMWTSGWGACNTIEEIEQGS